MAEPKPLCSQPSETKQKGDSLANDLARMILAARQIGEVVGEDLLSGPNWGLDHAGSLMVWECDAGPRVGIPDDIALDLLTARVWRGVRKYAVAFNWQDDAAMGEHIAVWHNHTDDVYMAPDLPSAVAAIHKHWKENR